MFVLQYYTILNNTETTLGGGMLRRTIPDLEKQTDLPQMSTSRALLKLIMTFWKKTHCGGIWSKREPNDRESRNPKRQKAFHLLLSGNTTVYNRHRSFSSTSISINTFHLYCESSSSFYTSSESPFVTFVGINYDVRNSNVKQKMCT